MLTMEKVRSTAESADRKQEVLQLLYTIQAAHIGREELSRVVDAIERVYTEEKHASDMRKCDICGRLYKADPRNVKRGWGLCCSKSCAAKKREMSKPGYDPYTVAENNRRRELYEDQEDGIEALGLDYLLECGSKD